MRLTAQLLSEEEKHLIHQQSLRILAEVGVRVHGEKGLPLLAAAGAQVDFETGIARIPAELVEYALAAARGPLSWGRVIRPLTTLCLLP